MRNLINFLLKYNYWFLFIVLEVASFVLLFRFNNYQQSTFFTSANVVVGAVYEVSGGISSYFHLKSVNADLLDRNMVLEQQITNLEKALREHQVDSVTVNSIKEIPLTDYQLFKAHVIKNSLNQADNYITLDQGSSSGIRPEMGVVVPNTRLVAKRHKDAPLDVMAYELPNPGILNVLLGAMKVREFCAAAPETVAKGWCL